MAEDFIKEFLNRSREAFLREARNETHSIARSFECMVPTKDGIKLRTIIQLPEGSGPFPTLVSRSPYPFYEQLNCGIGEEFVKRGYAVVTQFCRGMNGSEGEWVPNEHERADGIDLMKWLHEQEFVKSIGIHGVSYMALTGWIMADCLPDKVKGLFLCHYSVDRFKSAYKDGLFRHDVLTGWTMQNSGQARGKDFYDEYIASSLYRPHFKVDEKLWNQKLDWYRTWITSTDAGDPYWNTGVWGTLKRIPEQINVPVCVVAGWYDHHLEGTVLGYQKLAKEIRDKSKLIVGAWNHDFVPCVLAHPSQNAWMDMNVRMLQWFDGLVGKEEKPEPGIEVYIIGDDKWIEMEEWPIRSTKLISYYFTQNSNPDSKSQLLSEECSKEQNCFTFEFNPENPVWSVGGETLLVSEKERGSKLQPEPGYREDVVSFLSETLQEDLLIAGNINIKLFVVSDCEDTSFTAKVCEVLENGEAYNIRSGITTLAYRNHAESRIEYESGEIVEVNLELLPIAWRLKKGSKLRVDISSSNFPEYAIHTNTPGIWSLQERSRIAYQTVYGGLPFSSRIEIPVLGY